MSAINIVLITAVYLASLFAVAQWGKGRGKGFVKRFSGQFYALGIAVYCTGWTFYGSIGRAATHGLDFLAIYIGPIIAMPVWWFMLRKIHRIAKAQHLSSLSDFISARYGKNWLLGIVVTLLVVMSITPYLALQIKAISSSANVLLSDAVAERVELDLITTGLLFVFTLFYGLRFTFDPKERSGLIAAIGFESAFKLLAAFVGGWILVQGPLGGVGRVFERAEQAGMGHLLTIQDPHQWWWMIIISATAFILLPRQFQMAVVSNQNEKDIKVAMWMLPLYLLLMNWWIVPIALGGNLSLPGGSNPDYHFLNLALKSGSDYLPGLMFLGGLAASTSMIIVSSSALGTMVSSNLIIPATLGKKGASFLTLSPLNSRRVAVTAIFALAYFYYTYFVHETALVSIGMISFIGIAQLAPGFFSALFWRRAHSRGVLIGLLAGFAVWLTGFGLPQWNASGTASYMVFTLFEHWSPMANIIFLSLGLNTLLMVGISLVSAPKPLERTQAEIFYNIMNISRDRYDSSPLNSGQITFDRLEKMLLKFLPDGMISETLYKRYTIDRIAAQSFETVPAELVSYSERLLTQVIGPAAARIVLNREIQEESFNNFDIQDIIQESKETRQLNLALREKTETLERMTHQLVVANEQLQTLGNLKDDFLYTVTHELRSPLTAIRAQIEIIRDDEAMPEEVRNQFLDAAIMECERLTTLITTVLDIEKFESGNQQLSYKNMDLRLISNRVVESLRALAFNEGISLEINGPEHAWLYGDEQRIQQVFINLMSNALKYAKGTVKIDLKNCGESWCVSIIDDGDGVPEGDIPHLFDKFYQSNDQTVKKRIGTGLGLAISHNIIKAHGGKLELAQNPPNGPTTFAFTLPIKTTDL